ncbi:hypothetical protein YPPY14_3051, partial [Yersinia pestis PY-14]
MITTPVGSKWRFFPQYKTFGSQ